MASSHKPRLSLGEKLKLAAVVLFVELYFICARVKVIFSTFSGRQVQYISPTTVEAYKAWIQQKAKCNKNPALQERLVCDIQPLSVGESNILWLGNRHKASKVVLFIHGGGYVLPILPGHLEMCWNSYILPGVESGTETAVAALHYTLAPGRQYPTQLCEAAAAFSELCKAGFQPKDIIIGGDSAGGGLTLQLLHHLIHPHKEVERIPLGEPLAGVFLISPWTGTDLSGRSSKENEHSDMLSVQILNDLAAEAISKQDIEQADSQGDSWAGAARNVVHESWLSQLGSVTKTLYVTVGGREVLADQGIGLVDRLKKLNTGVDVRLECSEKEAHDFVVAEGLVGVVGEATIRMKDWFKQFLA